MSGYTQRGGLAAIQRVRLRQKVNLWLRTNPGSPPIFLNIGGDFSGERFELPIEQGSQERVCQGSEQRGDEAVAVSVGIEH